MHTLVRIAAYADRPPRFDCSGGLAVRETGSGVVHLVSTAATPLGGDEVRIDIDVHPGARLSVETVAATLAMPSVPNVASHMQINLSVAAGGSLDLVPLPTVVAANAIHHSVTRLRLDRDATVRITECVQIGRSGEDGGQWSGTLAVDLSDTDDAASPIELVRHRLDLSGASVDALSPTIPVLLNEFRFPDQRGPAVDMSARAARLPLARGGSVTTVLADSVPAAHRAAEGLAGGDLSEAPG